MGRMFSMTWREPLGNIHLFVSNLNCCNIEGKSKSDKETKYHITISSDPIGIISLYPKQKNHSDVIRQTSNVKNGCISSTQLIQPEDKDDIDWGDKEI